MTLPQDYMEKQALWIKRMQKAGVFPPDPEPPPDPPPKGKWRMAYQSDGTVLVEVNDVPFSVETALEIFRILKRDRVHTESGL